MLLATVLGFWATKNVSVGDCFYKSEDAQSLAYSGQQQRHLKS
jgi:hypothetical protein